MKQLWRERVEGLKKNTCEVVFVDFFDTLMFRKVTPYQVLERWALCIGKKYPNIPQEYIRVLPGVRFNVFRQCREELEKRKSETGISEVNYETAMERVYKKITRIAEIDNEKNFIETCRQIDIAVEIGCQYPDRKLIKKLEKMHEQGKKIYIVSDYYLSAAEIRIFLRAAAIHETIFEEIFVSSDIGKRKASGDIYPYLLQELGYQAKQVLMIGDNKKADIRNASIYGIQTKYRSSTWHRVGLYIRKKAGEAFGENQFAWAIKEMYQNGREYGEYIGIFYEFTRRLYGELREQKIKKISFMAREGYFLRQLFDKYQELCIEEKKQIDSMYYRCSRRSVMAGIKEEHMPDAINEKISIQNWLKSIGIPVEQAQQYVNFTTDEANVVTELEKSEIYISLMKKPEFCRLFDSVIKKNADAFKEYTSKFLDNGKLNFVDSGWKCTTQNILEEYYKIPTEGFYIGVQNPEKPIRDLKKHGLIFSESDPQSRYYQYLGMNIPFYQQMLAAPHGTVLNYLWVGNQILLEEEWDLMEKKLYEEYIRKIQEYMFLKFMGLCVWERDEIDKQKRDWLLARLSMKSSLFAKGSRLKFIRYCTQNYVQNFRQEKRGSIEYDIKKIKIKKNMLWNPDKMLRYISKIQRTAWYENKIVRVFYQPAVRILYGYILLVQKIKDLFYISNEA